MNDFKGFEDMHELPEAEIGGLEPKATAHSQPIGDVAIPGFVENCPKCGGGGNWRPGYRCFKCKGTGKLQFKTAPQARAKGRKYAKTAKVKKTADNAAAFLEWLDTEPDVRDWIVPQVAAGNGWASSMYQGGLKYGALTENMVRAIREDIAKREDSADDGAAWAEANPAEHGWLVAESDAGNEFAASLLLGQNGLAGRGTLSEGQVNAVRRNLVKAKEMPGSELDISSLKGYYAVPDGDSRLKLCVRKPGKNSRYHGWTFVDDGAAYGNRRTYGKQAPEGKYSGGVQDQLKAILADPKAAQVAYGKLTGTCGMCGRILEDEDSVAAGIGPICAAKFG